MLGGALDQLPSRSIRDSRCSYRPWSWRIASTALQLSKPYQHLMSETRNYGRERLVVTAGLSLAAMSLAILTCVYQTPLRGVGRRSEPVLSARGPSAPAPR